MEEGFKIDESWRHVLRNDARQVVLTHCHFKTSIHSANTLVNQICELVEKQYILTMEYENRKKVEASLPNVR